MAADLIFRLSFVFLNLLIGAAGAVLIIVGGIFLSMSQAFLGTISTSSLETFALAVLFNASVLFIIVGLIILLIAVLGIVGSIKHKLCGIVLLVYCIAIAFLVVLQILLVILLAVRSVDAKIYLQNNVTDLILPNLQNDTLLQQGLNQLQTFLQCCGISNTYLDYTSNSIPIPESCNCGSTSNTTCATISESLPYNNNNLTSVYTTNCIDEVLSHLDDQAFQYGLGAAAIAVVAIEILLILFAVCMIFLDLKKDRDD